MANVRGRDDDWRMQRRAETEWVELVRRFNESGQSRAQFAGENDLTPDGLGYWIRRLRRKQRDRAAMLPVRVVALTAPVAREPERNRSEIEAVLADGVRLTFPRGTKSQVITGIIARLR